MCETKFKHICPACRKEKVLVGKCKNPRCGRYICAECSIDDRCIDCFMLLNEEKEKVEYLNEKYGGVRISLHQTT